MAEVIRVVGVDPGIVSPAAVLYQFNLLTKRIVVLTSSVRVGTDLASRLVALQKKRMQNYHEITAPWNETHQFDHVFIEGYRSRSNFTTDRPMQEQVVEFKTNYSKVSNNTKVLDNMGIHNVVRPKLFRLFGGYDLESERLTHHSDIQSAAKIALFGMIKDPELNLLLSEIVKSAIKSGAGGSANIQGVQPLNYDDWTLTIL